MFDRLGYSLTLCRLILIAVTTELVFSSQPCASVRNLGDASAHTRGTGKKNVKAYGSQGQDVLPHDGESEMVTRY